MDREKEGGKEEGMERGKKRDKRAMYISLLRVDKSNSLELPIVQLWTEAIN